MDLNGQELTTTDRNGRKQTETVRIGQERATGENIFKMLHVMAKQLSTDAAIFRLNWPRGRFSETYSCNGILSRIIYLAYIRFYSLHLRAR